MRIIWFAAAAHLETTGAARHIARMMHDHPTVRWHCRRWADPLLRAAGLLLLLAAWRAGAGLHAMPVRPEPRDYLLALIAFMGASTGGAASLLGAHLFDRVAVSSRW